MSFLANLLKGGLFGKRQDDRDTVRELWHRIVAIAREKAWYRDCGVADTLAGRFDLITLVLSLVMLRMEREEALIPPSVWLTELFVDDMDGQLREQGVGDVGISKHVGKLMGTLGGRIGAYRDAPTGFRIWAGATIETADIAAVMHWLGWAFETQKATLAKAA